MKTLARERDRAEVLRRLKRVRPESSRRWGRMSVHQMVCHLADSFRMLTGDKLVSTNPGLLHRTLLKWIVLYLPLRWPAGILTHPDLDQYLGGTRPVDFASDIATVETLLALVTARAKNPDSASHPVFGKMSHAAWLRWGYLHMDHHLRQFGA